MAHQIAAVPELLLDTNSAIPLHRQLYEGLRGKRPAGSRPHATQGGARPRGGPLHALRIAGITPRTATSC